MMGFKKFFEMQRQLDAEIERKHPAQESEDRLAKKLLALSVELGECANEWRGFKFWSTDQHPRNFVQTKHEISEYKFGVRTIIKPAEFSNPLLEEYIDCIHFALSIGNDYTDRHGEGEGTSAFLNIFDYQEDEGDEYSKESIVCQFNGIYNLIGLLSNKTDGAYQVEYALDACSKMINNIIGLGEMLGFTWEQIEQAYMSKNAVNYQRQESGY